MTTSDFLLVPDSRSGLYEGGVWTVAVVLSDYYPYMPPLILFMNQIYHPNIEETSGKICLDVINENWNPMFSLMNVFELFLPLLLTNPNPHDPLNVEAGEMMLQDKATYEQRVREHCQRYAKPKEAAAAPEAQCSDGDASVEEEEDDGSSNEGARREPDP
ncbi:hypothetical protein SAY87_031214 [Trapa incisa]|uniref:UBC core domain-containing protein n=1 Tax=Trapa incisa TaxID=236973 RepID=A0AAN7KPE5_9MYRT|nr:hypothetical protein SAY87_031214 [Trapa incisa]